MLVKYKEDTRGITSIGTTTLTRLPPKQLAFWHSLGGTSINAAKKSRRKRTQHSYAQTLNTNHLYGTLSANIKLMQLKWSNVELPAL